MAIPLFLVSFGHTVTSPTRRGGKASRGRARTLSFLSASRLGIIIAISIIVQEDRETPTFQWLNRPSVLFGVETSPQ